MEVLKLEHIKVLDEFYEALRRIKRGSNEFQDHYSAILGFGKVEYLYFLTKDQAFATAMEYFHSLKIEVSKKVYTPKLTALDLTRKFKEQESKSISQFLKVLDNHLDDLGYEYTRRVLTGHPDPKKFLKSWTRCIKSLGGRTGKYNIIIKVGCDSGRRFFPVGTLLQ